MTCRLARWMHHKSLRPARQDPLSLQAVIDSGESVRRNKARAPEVAREAAILEDQLVRNHLAERMNLAMRRAHQT